MSDCLRSLSGRELKVTYDRDAGVIDLFDGDNRFLSNFWPVSVRYGGASYPSVEHAYQAAKCANPAERKQFRNITAGQAKRFGRHVQIRHDWEKVKIPIMFALLGTGKKKLVEGNTWGDTFWGVCNGEGHNFLGKLLMSVRCEAYDP